jgi:tetratricopeptide (TPR) repeat protein
MSAILPPDAIRERHLSEEEIAVLAEGSASPDEAGRAREHLARCRECMSAYADTVRYRAAWLALPQAFDEAMPLAAAAPSHAPSGPRAARMALMAAGAAAVILVTIAALGLRREHPAYGPSIAALLAQASSEGLVLPGGEAGAAVTHSRYRSDPQHDARGEQAVEDLRRAYESDGAARRDVYPLAAGLVAVGRLDLAHDYISEGRSRSPRDLRLAILEGVAAFRRGDGPGAEAALREALVMKPGDPLATLDLGLLTADLHGREAALPYLEDVIRRAPHSPLAARARQALRLSAP